MIITGVPLRPATQRKIGIEHYTPAPGSMTATCRLCNELFWIGPKQREFIGRTPDTVMICFHCCVEYFGQSINPAVITSAGGTSGKFKLSDGTHL